MTTADTVRSQSQQIASLAQKIQSEDAQLATFAQTKTALQSLSSSLRAAQATGAPLAARRWRVAQLQERRDALRAGRSS